MPAPDAFDELMPKDPRDRDRRLMRHARICQTSADSIRLTQALTGKGVTPLS